MISYIKPNIELVMIYEDNKVLFSSSAIVFSNSPQYSHAILIHGSPKTME